MSERSSTHSHGHDRPKTTIIDKRDFDAHRSVLSHSRDDDNDNEHDRRRRLLRRSIVRESSSVGEEEEEGEGEEDGLLNDVVETIVQRDRRRLKREITRGISFVWSVISCLGAGSITTFSLYGPQFLNRLHYTQRRVNEVSIAAEVAMYLPVSIVGYLCDRFSPAPISLASAVLFGVGYTLAALVYRSGPPVDVGGNGWPHAVMVGAFALIGAGTCCMYSGAVTACAKNFGRGRRKGVMLAAPIAAFGLSGVWQSMVGAYLLKEHTMDGVGGEGVDVFRYFVFLAVLLTVTGAVGGVALQVVDDEEEDEDVKRIDPEDGLLRPQEDGASYGTFAQRSEEAEEEHHRKAQEKRTWQLNHQTQLFLRDQTMWWLALGFFFVTGPGEAYFNNLGTIIDTLWPTDQNRPPAGRPSTHVSVIALTSTTARLLMGSITDIFAPAHPQRTSANYRRTPTLSRLAFLLPCALLAASGFLLLASPLPLHHPNDGGALLTASGLVGFGYGGAFALMPIVISVVWGVSNFGTNWGIVAMVPAAGASFWGLVYSAGYQNALDKTSEQCHGWRCFGYWALGCAGSLCAAVVVWAVAWRVWVRRGVVV